MQPILSSGYSSWRMLYADAHCPMAPGKARRLPIRALPTFSLILAPTKLQAIATHTTGNKKIRTKGHPLLGFSKHFNFFPSCNWVFEMFFPRFQTRLCSSQYVFFQSWIIVLLTPVPGCLHCPKGFRFFDSHSAF